MSRIKVDYDVMKNIADAIRIKTGFTSLMFPSQMADMINGLELMPTDTKKYVSAISFAFDKNVRNIESVTDLDNTVMNLLGGINISDSSNFAANVFYSEADRDGLKDAYILTNGEGVLINISAKDMFNGLNNLVDIPSYLVDYSKVSNASGMFRDCSKLNIDPIVMPNVVNMAYTYYNCVNLQGAPYAGQYVTDMNNAFARCKNITGVAACPDNVTNFMSAYENCSKLQTPKCGSNVKSMAKSYANCDNLIGPPVVGSKVENMYRAYYHCYALKGNPVIQETVTDLSGAYQDCANLTGAPVTGPLVKTMDYSYKGCVNLTGEPVCGNNVINMAYAYQQCRNLQGSAVCGNSVQYMNYAYDNCRNITKAACGPEVKTLAYAYRNCKNITEAVCGPNVTSMVGAYQGCNNITEAICGDNVVNLSNAYADCPNIRGNFILRTSLSGTPAGLNIKNVFKGRDTSEKLNIYVYPNSYWAYEIYNKNTPLMGLDENEEEILPEWRKTDNNSYFSDNYNIELFMDGTGL